MRNILKKIRILYLSLLFIPVGIVVYFNSFGNGFVFDDSFYVTENPLIKNPSLSGIKDIFTEFYRWDYLPLTIFSLWVDYYLYGLNPEGYHLTNTLLHITGAILLYGLIFRVTRSSVTALWVSLLFLVHPVHVESVAWISERKNVLSLIFFILSFNYYLDEGPRLRSVLFFLLACFSKTTVVIFPLLLMLYDFCFQEKSIKENFIPKIPYFMVTLAIFCIALMTHSQGGIVQSHPDGNPAYTLFSMIPVFKEYLVKLLFPVNLNIWYPNQIYRSFWEFQVLLSSVVLGLFIFLLKISYRRNRTVFFGLAWFLISLLPVSHIIPFPQMMADRLLYIPSIGIFLAVVSGFRLAVGQEKILRANITAFAVMVLVSGLVLLSANRIPIYKENLTLWQDSIRRNENNTISMMYLGTSHWIKGDREKALEKFQKAREVEPENIRAAMSMGQIYEEQGKFKDAEKTYLEVIKQAPDNKSVYNHLAVLYGHRGQLGKALSLLDKTLSLDPALALAHYNRAVFLLKAERFQEALLEFQEAVQLEPRNPMFRFNLGMFYAKNTDQPGLGRVHLEESLRLDPDQAEASHIRETLATLPINQNRGR